MNVDAINRAISSFSEMKPDERRYVLLTLLNDETIDLADAMAIYAQHLQEFKNNAKKDIYKLSTAGLELASSNIKKIPKIKRTRGRQLALAQTKTLISGGGYSGTEAEAELLAGLDFSELDGDWYESSWKLKTVETPDLTKENL